MTGSNVMSSATCDIYNRVTSTLTDTGKDETVYNPFTTAIAASTFIVIAWWGDSWYVIAEDC